MVGDATSGLCLPDAAIKQQELAADYDGPLLRDASRFQNAQGINHSLRELYTLLAQDRISSRRAAVLAYITSLLLRSLPAIDNDPYPQAGDAPVCDVDPVPSSQVDRLTITKSVDRFAVTKSDDPPQPQPEDAVKSSKPN